MKQFATIATILGLLFLSTTMEAQDTALTKALNKAEKLYKSYKYNAAIPYYEFYLEKEKKSKVLSVKTKLAYSYRMANKPTKAAAIYADLVEAPRVKPIILFYYGETLMASGKYAEAKNYFVKYETLKPDDKKVGAMIDACNKVNTIQPYFVDIDIELADINTEADEFSPIFYEDGIAFLSDQGANGKTYAWTGRPFLKLYKSTKTSNGRFVDTKNFSSKINGYKKHTGPVSISRDGETLMITRNSDVPTQSNRFNLQIFEATKKGENWTRGKVINICKPNKNYMHPALTPSGDTMYFVSDKGAGAGGTDIYMTYRTPKGWKRPKNLGDVINTSGHEAFPFVHKDGTLYFASKGHGGFGGFDIYKAERNADGEFERVINVGEPINSPKDDTGFILDDKKESGYFASSRMAGNDDIYFFQNMGVAMKGNQLAYNSANPASLNMAKSARNIAGNAGKIQMAGKIIDAETGKALTNVKVILETKKGIKLKELSVDGAGNVSGYVLKGETYVVSIQKIGYKNKSTFIQIGENQNSIKPVFKLQKKK